jgi:hypothetical protein
MRKLIVVALSLVAIDAAIAAPNELATSNLNTPAGKMTRLAAKTSYRAGSFPLGLQLTAPDGTWAGSQWTTSSKGQTTFAWAAIGHGGTAATSAPRGLVMIATAIGTTRSVSATVARIRTGGGGITFGTTSPAKMAGYTGTQFDGNVFGSFGHTFVPFTPKTHGAAPSDAWHIDKGEAFRFTVISVRTKTVVVFEESFGLPAKQFPGFLTGAKQLLATLQFTA